MATDYASLYDTALDAVATAITGANWATARQQYALARVYASHLPDYSTGSRSINRGTAFKELDSLKEAIDAAQIAGAGTGSVQLVPIQFGRPA